MTRWLMARALSHHVANVARATQPDTKGATMTYPCCDHCKTGPHDGHSSPCTSLGCTGAYMASAGSSGDPQAIAGETGTELPPADSDAPTCGPEGADELTRLWEIIRANGATNARLSAELTYERAEVARLAAECPDIWGEVKDERARAHIKHGDRSMEVRDWADMARLRILVEEVGEVAKCFNEWDLGHLTTDETKAEARTELIQVAAMAGAWADVVNPAQLDKPITTDPVTCGGCAGLGSHKRWCAAVVGDLASHLGTYSEDAEHLADMVGANCAGAANALYRAAGLLDAAATEAVR